MVTRLSRSNASAVSLTTNLASIGTLSRPRTYRMMVRACFRSAAMTIMVPTSPVVSASA